jgi:sugar lactone lactonase YvrE
MVDPMNRALLSYCRRPWSKENCARLRAMARACHIHAFGEEPACFNSNHTMKERDCYVTWMRGLAPKSDVLLHWVFASVGYLATSITRGTGMSALVLAVLWAAGAWPAFSQTSPIYAWTNFAGQPGFEGSTDGTDSVSHSGSADGRGSEARFYCPNNVAVDSAGNVFVADTRNHTIRKVTPDGVVTTLAGCPGAKGMNDDTVGMVPWLGPDGEPLDGPGASGTNDGTSTAARFYAPKGVAVDSADNLLVADSYNNTIRQVNPAGFVTTLAGSAGNRGSADGTGSTVRFNEPDGVAVDNAGNLFVADTWNRAIRKVSPAGVVTTLVGKTRGLGGSADATGSAAGFSVPSGVAVDGAGNLFVADWGNHAIWRITPSGVVTTLAGSASNDRVGGYADGKGSTARFSHPSGIAVDSAGNLFVADSGNSVVRKVTSAGVVTTIGGAVGVIGWADGIGSSAHFYCPSGIAVDRAGNLYVADSPNNRISKGTPVRP